MPFNGTGTFTRTIGGGDTAWSARTGLTITTSNHDTHDGDIATALSNCICKDGQQTITADIPWSSNKITGLGDATAHTDACNAGQVQDGTFQWLGSSSGTNTITASGTPAVTAYAAGQLFRFTAGGTNTGATTLNIDSVGATSVTRQDNSALTAGDIQSGEEFEVLYNGSAFILLNPSDAWAAAGANSDITSLTACTSMGATSDNVNITTTTSGNIDLSSAGTIIFATGGTDRVILTSNNLTPGSAGGSNLGTSSLDYNGLWVRTVQCISGQDMTIQTSAANDDVVIRTDTTSGPALRLDDANNTLRPETDGSVNLGTSSVAFNGAHIKVLNFDTTLGATASTIAGAIPIQVGGVSYRLLVYSAS